MNKKFLIFVMVALVVLLLSKFISFKEFDREKLVSNQSHDLYVETMGMDANLLLVTQKKYIYESQLIFLKEFETVEYIVDSSNDYEFIRDWSKQHLVLNVRETKIVMYGYLFIDQFNNYHVMVNFKVPYELSNEIESQYYDFAEVKYSDTYDLRFPRGFSLLRIYDREYDYDAYNDYYRHKKIRISSERVSDFKIDRTIVSFIWFELRPKNEESNDFLECQINLFDFIPKSRMDVVLGYNSFRTTGIQYEEKYSPKCIRVIYYKENI